METKTHLVSVHINGRWHSAFVTVKKGELPTRDDKFWMAAVGRLPYSGETFLRG